MRDSAVAHAASDGKLYTCERWVRMLDRCSSRHVYASSLLVILVWDRFAFDGALKNLLYILLFLTAGEFDVIPQYKSLPTNLLRSKKGQLQNFIRIA